MDYTKQSLSFKIRKGLRYLQLYGLSRTRAKIDAQYHMNKKYEVWPGISNKKNNNGHVGILGCGKFGYSNIAYYLRKNFGQVLGGVMDIDLNKSASLFEKHKAGYYTDNPHKVLQDPNIDLVYICSNHASHAEYAIEALNLNKSVHIEKPHAVTLDQLQRLCDAMEGSQGRVRLGFNRPNSVLGKMVQDHLEVESGTTMLNWFVAGHEIEPEHWYFAPEEGGRILGNLCHWTDLIYQMIPEKDRFPIEIIPTRAEKSDCDIAVSLIFGDGSMGSITFSAKGHTFEGVRETLSAHKGNTLIELKDFRKLRIDVVDKVKKKKLRYRDHGHKQAVLNSYNMLNNSALAESQKYVWETGYLVLKVKEALDLNQKMRIEGFEKSYSSKNMASN